MPERGVPGKRLAFDDDVWAEEVERFRRGSRARASAQAARREIERPDSRIAVRPCQAVGPDGTRLKGCAKVYVPISVAPSEAPYGFVFEITADADSKLTLRLVAFGERHPARGRSVYERAHRRLYGRYPSRA